MVPRRRSPKPRGSLVLPIRHIRLLERQRSLQARPGVSIAATGDEEVDTFETDVLWTVGNRAGKSSGSSRMWHYTLFFTTTPTTAITFTIKYTYKFMRKSDLLVEVYNKTVMETSVDF